VKKTFAARILLEKQKVGGLLHREEMENEKWKMIYGK